MAGKKSFILYDNYIHQLEFLNMEQRGELLTAIFEYRVYRETKTQLSQTTQLVFSFIKDTLERDAEAYERRCEANRENGKKGGRPPKKSSPSKPKKPKKADNDNDIENGNDNENENDIDIENGNDNGLLAASPPSRVLSKKGTRKENPWNYTGVQKTYDLDEFFEAALRRGMRDLSESEREEQSPAPP